MSSFGSQDTFSRAEGGAGCADMGRRAERKDRGCGLQSILEWPLESIYLLYTKINIRMFNRATTLIHIIKIILTVRFKISGYDLIQYY
jgi:hypothetical protein